MKDHFNGDLVPEFAWRNDMLNELRKINDNMNRLFELQQPKEPKVTHEPRIQQPVHRGRKVDKP